MKLDLGLGFLQSNPCSSIASSAGWSMLLECLTTGCPIACSMANCNHAVGVLVDKINASRITSSRSLKGATFLLADWRLSHPKELPGDLPVLWDCHTLTMNTTVLQLSDAVADISMLQCSAPFRILFINAHFVVDNATHALASSATTRPTFRFEEEEVVIRNGWTPKGKGRDNTHYKMTVAAKLQ